MQFIISEISRPSDIAWYTSIVLVVFKCIKDTMCRTRYDGDKSCCSYCCSRRRKIWKIPSFVKKLDAYTWNTLARKETHGQALKAQVKNMCIKVLLSRPLKIKNNCFSTHMQFSMQMGRIYQTCSLLRPLWTSTIGGVISGT